MKDDDIEELVKILCEKYEKEIKDKKVNHNQSEKKKKKKLEDPFEKKIKKKNEEIKIDYDSIIKKIIDLSKKNQNIYPNDKEVDENSKKYFTMSSINKFCRTIMILKNKFKKIEKITQKSIINFSFELLFEEHLSSENIEIQNYLFEELKESNIKNKDYEEIYLNKEKYYFAESDSLKKLMIQMYACSLVNQYLCIIGPTGIGKTIGARTFSYIRENIYNNKKKNCSPFYMHTFNQFTRPSDYYGISSIQNGKIVFNDGTLTKSINNGKVFIADEFNISSENCMKAITPILELNFNKEIIIPGIEKKIKISPDFFFIICQNTRNTFGRKELPEKIKVKLKIINYPEIIETDIQKICVSIYNNYPANIKENLSEDEAKACGKFMMKLNEREYLSPWSLRDISKLFERIYKQSKKKSNFKNLNLTKNILFYILPSTTESLISERLKDITELIKEIFGLNSSEKENLEELYLSQPYLIIQNEINSKKNFYRKKRC